MMISLKRRIRATNLRYFRNLQQKELFRRMCAPYIESRFIKSHFQSV
jgi:hypothetical protein